MYGNGGNVVFKGGDAVLGGIGGTVLFKGGIGGAVLFNSSEGGFGKPETPDGVAENGSPKAVKG